MKGKHARKIIFTIIIASFVGLYFLSMAIFLVGVSVNTNKWWIGLFAIIPAALLAMLIAVTIQRIKEVMEGQEDDLSKY